MFLEVWIIETLRALDEDIGTTFFARSDKQHCSFAIIDNKTVLTGSFNWSPSAAHTNDETLLGIHSPQLVQHFTRETDCPRETAEGRVKPHGCAAS